MSQGACPDPYSSDVFYLGHTFETLEELGVCELVKKKVQLTILLAITCVVNTQMDHLNSF
jgi:hypothetical protein